MTSDDTQTYRVVVNDEDQYSVWQDSSPNPAGWRDGGFTGSKDECFAHISVVWTDMRPRSVREFTAADESR